MGKRQGYDYDATSHESNRSITFRFTVRFTFRYSLDLRPITTEPQIGRFSPKISNFLKESINGPGKAKTAPAAPRVTTSS